jgi:ATP-dependent protease ClpP protease subunit
MPLTTILNSYCPSIRLTGEIDMTLALSLVDELTLLHEYYQFRTVELQINSPGGDAQALHFLVRQLEPWRKSQGRTLKTLGVSEIASAAAMLLSFGSKGHRSALKGSRLLYHPVRTLYPAGISLTGAQLRGTTRQLARWDKYFVDLMAEHIAGEDVRQQDECRETLKRLFRREKYITPEEACKMKLIDTVGRSL